MYAIESACWNAELVSLRTVTSDTGPAALLPAVVDAAQDHVDDVKLARIYSNPQ